MSFLTNECIIMVGVLGLALLLYMMVYCEHSTDMDKHNSIIDTLNNKYLELEEIDQCLSTSFNTDRSGMDNIYERYQNVYDSIVSTVDDIYNSDSKINRQAKILNVLIGVIILDSGLMLYYTYENLKGMHYG